MRQTSCGQNVSAAAGPQMCEVRAFRGSESYIIATLSLLEVSNVRSSIAEMGGGGGGGE